MTSQLERTIARVARERGLSFYAAARVVGRWGRCRKNARTREADKLTRVRSTWAWKRDFE